MPILGILPLKQFKDYGWLYEALRTVEAWQESLGFSRLLSLRKAEVKGNAKVLQSNDPVGLMEYIDQDSNIAILCSALGAAEDWKLRLKPPKNKESTPSAWIYLKDRLSGVGTGYSIIGTDGATLVSVRDPVGQCPLYYGNNQELYAISSTKKILWALGISETNILPRGRLEVVYEEGHLGWMVYELSSRENTKTSLEEASETICKLLSASIGYVSASSNRVGILFSGGLDSSVVATAATNAGLKPRLYTAAFPGSTDVKTAEKSAKTLGLDLNLTVVTGDKAEDTVKRTVWAVESSDPLQVCVALPLNIAAEAAVECGERVLLTGSGCDELFGGYARYLQLGSYEELSNALIKDVLRLGEREFARDAAIGEANGVHIYTPFAYLDLVNFALSLHPIYKIDNQAEEPRKRVLRLSARRLGIPAEISDLPKKAAQYSSGSLKAVQKLAKAHGLNTWGYLSLVFNEVFSGLRRM